MAQVGIERRSPGFLVAHSLSADAALQAALAEPRALRAMVIASPVVWGHEWSEDWRELWKELRAAAAAGRVGAAFERWRRDRLFGGLHDRPDLMAAVTEMQSMCSGVQFLQDEPAAGPTTLERLAGCKVPLLVLEAEHDRDDFHRMAQAVAALVPHAEHRIVRGSGHFPNLEVPEVFTSLVEEFMAAHAPKPSVSA
jgi:pimeloyl-ACP methyl ester carboxylesterase